MTLLYGTSNRSETWQVAGHGVDLIVVGGGITGAGILREASRAGLSVLLLEQNDFSSGTSSRSSKMVHGGLRYLNNMQFALTWQSVTEREVLLRDGDGLVDKLPFIYPTYKDDSMPSWMVEIGLYMYGLMGGKWHIHRTYDKYEVQMMSPGLSVNGLNGGLRFYDAQTDDSRLVLRVIREAVNPPANSESGRALALNYARVSGLCRDKRDQVCGVTVEDRVTGEIHQVSARAVVNATGAWADRLRADVGGEPRIRPLRGSHLIFRADRFPVYQAVSFPHPEDRRPVFAFPWEGVTLVGTTDLDHYTDLDEEPSINQTEVDYLLEAINHHFPALGLTEHDVLVTFAGVRPVISHGEDVDPSKESREHALWQESGLLTVTGGKLTTFRQIALDAIRALRPIFPELGSMRQSYHALDPAPVTSVDIYGLTDDDIKRLVARYGDGILGLIEASPAADRRPVRRYLPVHWFELRWAAQHEAVEHLDDLLLRRVRLGLLLPDGAIKLMPRIRERVQEPLGWDDARWDLEVERYQALWEAHYSPRAAQYAQQSYATR